MTDFVFKNDTCIDTVYSVLKKSKRPLSALQIMRIINYKFMINTIIKVINEMSNKFGIKINRIELRNSRNARYTKYWLEK